MERRQFIKYASLSGVGLTFAACRQGNNSPSSSSPSVAVSSPSITAVAGGQPLQVGFVYQGLVGDLGWTYAHDLGRREMEANLQGRVKTTFIESVNAGVDAEKVIRQLAQAGNQLIFATSSGFMNQILQVAPDFPQIAFESCVGSQRDRYLKPVPNVGTYMGRLEEPRYLTGMMAGKMTKSNLIGYIATTPIPEVIRGINAFTQAVRATNPQAQVRIEWVKSLYDPSQEKDAAQALINAGADILAQHTDSAAAIQLAEEKGIYAFGYNTDMSKFGLKAHLTSAISQWGKFYTETAQAVMNGTWKAEDVWYGISQQMVDISQPMNAAIPSEVQQLVMAKRQEFINNQAHPFTGPMKDQKGVLRVPPGKVLTDQEQLTMNWFVEGSETINNQP